MRKKLLLAVVAVSAMGCASLGRQAFQQPVVTLRDVRLNGVGLTGGSIDVQLNVYNPNGYRLDATRLTYNLLVDTVRVATGALDRQMTLMEGDSTVVTIPVNFTYAGIGEAGRQLINTGSVDYTVNGDITATTVVGRFTVPYSSSGRFSALTGASR